jgi:hypothetical protein
MDLYKVMMNEFQRQRQSADLACRAAPTDRPAAPAAGRRRTAPAVSLYELLRDRGFHLTTASSGSEAIAHLSRCRFDLVLLDLRLPDIGGHEIMDFINERASTPT